MNTSTKQQMTIEQLAEKLGGNLWEKEDLKRIYLRAGHQTKKMSTKTYVYEHNGEFRVNCSIDCPSQPYSWIASQQDQIIEGVEAGIADALATTIYYVVNADGNPVNINQNEVPLNDLEDENEFFISEAAAKRFFENNGFGEGYKIAEMDKEEFEAETKRMDEIFFAAAAKKREEAKAAQAIEVAKKPKPAPIPETYGVECKVKHNRFGEGTVISEEDNKVLIDFPEVGEKSLLKAFAKLEILENGK